MKTHTSDGISQRLNEPNVCIIPHLFLDKTDKFHLDDLIELLTPIADKIFVITGGASDNAAGGRELILYDNPAHGVEIVPIRAKRRASLLFIVFEQTLAQLQILRALSKLRNKADILVLFLGGIQYPEHFILAKYSNMRRLVIVTGSGSAAQIQPIKESGNPRQFGELIRVHICAIFERLSFYLSEKLIVYDDSLIDRANLRQFGKKVIVAHRHSVNFDEYQLTNNIDQRDNVVTYVGRLHEEKGVLNLVEAIPQVLSKQDDVQFVIVGEGHLENKIRSYLDRHSLDHEVTLTGWIPHQRLPDYYAKSKLLVLPSYTEGLPHVMLEAMACGTPVLATSVGAIPKVITDGETGFLMHDNSPTCLAENIVEALTYPGLKRIVLNARNFVEREYRYEKVLQTWKRLICNPKGEQYPS